MSTRDADEAIQVALRSFGASRRNELIELSTELGEGVEAFGRWLGPTSVRDRVATPTYFEYSAHVSRILELIQPLMVPFAWPAWHEGIQALRFPLSDESRVSAACAVKLVTTIVRAERFSEGLLLSKLEDGSIGALLRSILEADNQ